MNLTRPKTIFLNNPTKLIAIIILTLVLISNYFLATIRNTQDEELTIETNLEEPFVRAVILYLPTHNHFMSNRTEQYNAELKWFIRSWQEMQKYETPSWRTDVLVFTSRFTPILSMLNCTKKLRQDRKEIGRCIGIANYTPIIWTHRIPNKFADSINVVTQIINIPGVNIYDWILRSDLDTFLTPSFGNFKPSKLMVGAGKYIIQYTMTEHRLARIAHDLNLTTQGITNIGSTWYGPLQQIYECAKLSVSIMEYLDKWEFTRVDKNPKMYETWWPEWSYGILSMYSGQLAINHCTRETGFLKNGSLLDVQSMSDESIWDHPHVHTWVMDKGYFSKTEFFQGKYNNWTYKDKDVNIIRNYALYMALDSM